MLPLALLLLLSPNVLLALRYPNEIVETPTVVCETDRIVVKVRTTSSNPSIIYAEDYHDTAECVARHMNRIEIFHNSCGMTAERMKTPSGTTYRICLAVQIHPLFVTESDRSYCAQCVYMDSNIVEDLQQTIAVSESVPNELDPQFDEFSTPKCTYSIRRGTVDGTPIHYATIGETVFHVWQCDNGMSVSLFVF
uniref:ZP domain-containing protein n=1 Tax=Steinernema glaseri TaxID=37863 RepID=A0A1I7ZF04_9BILA